MNQFFYESRGKEKMQALISEGMNSQAALRSVPRSAGIRHSLPRLAAVALAVLVILGVVLG